jgi:hypothetical protein
MPDIDDFSTTVAIWTYIVNNINMVREGRAIKES